MALESKSLALEISYRSPAAIVSPGAPRRFEAQEEGPTALAGTLMNSLLGRAHAVRRRATPRDAARLSGNQ